MTDKQLTGNDSLVVARSCQIQDTSRTDICRSCNAQWTGETVGPSETRF